MFNLRLSLRLGRFIECSRVLPTSQFAYWKSFGTCGVFLWESHSLQRDLETGQGARIIQIVFSAAFYWVNHQGQVLYHTFKHSFSLIGHSMPVEAKGLLWFRIECLSGLFCTLSYSSCAPRSLFSILENKLCGYADDSTLVGTVASPSEKIAVAESLNRVYNSLKVSKWCDFWRVKLNTIKITTMRVSRTRTIHPQSTS